MEKKNIENRTKKQDEVKRENETGSKNGRNEDKEKYDVIISC